MGERAESMNSCLLLRNAVEGAQKGGIIDYGNKDHGRVNPDLLMTALLLSPEFEVDHIPTGKTHPSEELE
jgi:hypothetical protein